MIKIGNILAYGIIYKITNKVNGKVYIGQTTSSNGFNGRYPFGSSGINRVFKYHEYNKKHNFSYNPHLYSAILKYGEDNFEVSEIFDIAFSKQELDIKEKIYIKYFNCIKDGYNRLEGGQVMPNNIKYSDELVCNIKKMYATENITPKEISEYFKVKRSIVNLILGLKYRTNVGEEFNEIILYKKKYNLERIYLDKCSQQKIIEDISREKEREIFLEEKKDFIINLYFENNRSLSKVYNIIKFNYCNYISKKDISNLLYNNNVLRKTKKNKSTRKT